MENNSTVSKTERLKQFYLSNWQWIWTTVIGLLVAVLTLWIRFELLQHATKIG